jgi:hypothetical protein
MLRVNIKMFRLKIIQVTRNFFRGYLSNFQAAVASVSGFHPRPVILAISFSISREPDGLSAAILYGGHVADRFRCFYFGGRQKQQDSL